MKLWIIMGISGAGKSTKAKQISNEQTDHPKICENDLFFINNKGEYVYNGNLFKIARKWCYDQTEEELKAGRSVIVANTFLRKKTRKHYIDLGKKYNAEIEVIVCTGNYQNVHDVPEKVLEDMKKQYEPFSPDELK